MPHSPAPLANWGRVEIAGNLYASSQQLDCVQQRKRTGARNPKPASGDLARRLEEYLARADGHYVWQSPSMEGSRPFLCAGREEDGLRLDRFGLLGMAKKCPESRFDF